MQMDLCISKRGRLASAMQMDAWIGDADGPLHFQTWPLGFLDK
jgi:hypothetical protein